MRGLPPPPTLAQLSAAADVLQRRDRIEEHVLALYTQWSRFDPRFAEILVSRLTEVALTISLESFLDQLAKLAWPRSASVLFDFAALAANDRRISAHATTIRRRFPRIDGVELFFIPLQWPNPVVTRHELTMNAAPYRRAGFIGAQALLPHARWPDQKTRLNARARLDILHKLLKTEREVTVAQYRTACVGMISTRQAQRDLARVAKPKGFTRNRRYRAITSV